MPRERGEVEPPLAAKSEWLYHLAGPCPLASSAAERRAQRVRVATNAAATTAILLTTAPCCLSCLLMRYLDSHDPNASVWLIRGAEASAWLSPLAIAIVFVVVLLKVIGRGADRRAATPLPPPPVDPLATYRDGPPAECPRHPFAR